MSTPSDEAVIPPVTTTVLDRKTLIPISIAVSVFVSFLAAWGWLDNKFTVIADKLDTQTKAYDERFGQYDRRLERVEIRATGAWSKIDETLWVSEFRRLNPDMKIPDVRTR